MSLTFNAYVTDFTVKCQWHNCSKVDSFSLFLVRHSLFSPVKPPFRVLFCEFPMSRPFTFCKEYSLFVEGCCLGDVDEMHRLLSASLRGCPHWRTTFCAQRAIASISREKSWKAVAKKASVVKSRCKKASVVKSREKPLLKSISGESRCKNIHASPLRPLRLGEKKYPATVALLLQSRMDFSRRAAEFIEPRSYCFWELERAERPSVLRGVHRDAPTLFSHYLLNLST